MNYTSNIQRDMIPTEGGGWIATTNPVKYINVTREDLKNSYKNPKSCPIATACTIYFSMKCSAGREIVRVWKGNRYHSEQLYSYHIRKKDDRKSFNRSKSSFLRWLLGGFTIKLIPTNE